MNPFEFISMEKGSQEEFKRFISQYEITFRKDEDGIFSEFILENGEFKIKGPLILFDIYPNIKIYDTDGNEKKIKDMVGLSFFMSDILLSQHQEQKNC